MINRRHIGLALGMATAVALTAGAMIASTSDASAQSADLDDLNEATSYVTVARNNLASGEPISWTVTKPYGCSVKY